MVVTIGIPAAKWYKTDKYEKNIEKLEDDEIDDKRNTDLRYYKLNDINSQITLLSVKILEPDQNKEEIKKKIAELESEGNKIREELEKNTEGNFKEILQRYNEIDKVKADLVHTYKKYNKLAWIILSGIAIVYGTYIANILQS